MKKPILSGFCLILKFLCYSQAISPVSSFTPSILSLSAEQYSLYNHNLNAQGSFLSQWSTITDHPYYTNLGVSYIHDFRNETKPETSLDINSAAFGPFKNIACSFSLGILKSIKRNKFGYRGGIQIAYEQTQLNTKQLVWSDPLSENTSFKGNNSVGFGYYLGAWYSLGNKRQNNVFIFTFESSNQISKFLSKDKSSYHPFTGRYTLNYHLMQEDSRFSSLYQLDLDQNNKLVHLIAFKYYFPFKIYGGVLGTSTKSAGFETGYYWTLNNAWDTSFDISYQYIHSLEEYGFSVGDSHQISLKCSGIF